MPDVELRPIEEATWPEAMRLCARAFVDYGYVHAIFGDDPLERIVGTTKEFGGVGWDAERISIGAWVGGVLVGTASVEPLGGCRVCHPRATPHDAEEDERLAAAGARFDEARRIEHEPVPPHGHVTLVAVEPAVQGVGIGPTVVRAVVGAFGEQGGGPLVLECITPLEGFYANLGFLTIGGFAEADSEDIVVMRADI